MKTKLINFLKIGIPLGLGIFLIWLSFSKLTAQDIEDIKYSFKHADYLWIWISVALAILSHVSRAYRWKYTLEPLNYHPRFLNSFMAVMIGYLVNLGIPRMGEVSRAAAMTKYEDIPFNKGFGTIVAERVADTILLLVLIASVVIIQLSKLQDFLIDRFKDVNVINYAIIGIVLLLGAFVFFRLVQRSEIAFFVKLREFISGLLEGVKSILNMKDSGKFLMHTFLIWFLYVLMFYIAMFAIPGLRSIPTGAVLSAFVIGGISIAVTNGGIGAYPYGIMQILLLYGISKADGLAFGWIVWTAQTIMIVALGGLSFIFMPIYNKDLDAQSTLRQDP